jgi:copper resistance protein C
MKRVVAVVALALLGVLATATPAQAHSYLVDSTPEVGATLTTLPEKFSVTANEPLLDLAGNGSGFGIEIVDENGLYYGDGCVDVEGPRMFTDAALGDPGRYVLVYQFVSADGHPVSDQFSFDWAPTGDVTASAGSTSPGDCDGLYARGDGSGGDGAGSTADAASIDLSAVLWIGGALLAVGIAVVVTLIVLRPKRK